MPIDNAPWYCFMVHCRHASDYQCLSACHAECFSGTRVLWMQTMSAIAITILTSTMFQWAKLFLCDCTLCSVPKWGFLARGVRSWQPRGDSNFVNLMAGHCVSAFAQASASASGRREKTNERTCVLLALGDGSQGAMLLARWMDFNTPFVKSIRRPIHYSESRIRISPHPFCVRHSIIMMDEDDRENCELLFCMALVKVLKDFTSQRCLETCWKQSFKHLLFVISNT